MLQRYLLTSHNGTFCQVGKYRNNAYSQCINLLCKEGMTDLHQNHLLDYEILICGWQKYRYKLNYGIILMKTFMLLNMTSCRIIYGECKKLAEKKTFFFTTPLTLLLNKSFNRAKYNTQDSAILNSKWRIPKNVG